MVYSAYTSQRLSQIKTKRELIETALREFIDHRKRLDLRDLKGTELLDDEYDYKQSRSEGTGSNGG